MYPRANPWRLQVRLRPESTKYSPDRARFISTVEMGLKKSIRNGLERWVMLNREDGMGLRAIQPSIR